MQPGFTVQDYLFVRKGEKLRGKYHSGAVDINLRLRPKRLLWRALAFAYGADRVTNMSYRVPILLLTDQRFIFLKAYNQLLSSFTTHQIGGRGDDRRRPDYMPISHPSYRRYTTRVPPFWVRDSSVSRVLIEEFRNFDARRRDHGMEVFKRSYPEYFARAVTGTLGVEPTSETPMSDRIESPIYWFEVVNANPDHTLILRRRYLDVRLRSVWAGYADGQGPFVASLDKLAGKAHAAQEGRAKLFLRDRREREELWSKLGLGGTEPLPR